MKNFSFSFFTFGVKHGGQALNTGPHLKLSVEFLGFLLISYKLYS